MCSHLPTVYPELKMFGNKNIIGGKLLPWVLLQIIIIIIKHISVAEKFLHHFIFIEGDKKQAEQIIKHKS